ncbi:MAG: hypothetical protein GXP62_18140 [Oligoflexia bacterium]|nr:hypothetical protein [Oligoflexia bacterium]
MRGIPFVGCVVGLAAVPLLGVGCKKDASADTGTLVEPSLELTSPAAGAWLPIGATPVSGQVQEVRSVQVNGVAATMDAGGSFAGQVSLDRGVNVVEAQGTATNGDELYARHGVLAGEFDSATGAVAEAAVVRLNQGGLDTLMDMVGGMLDQTALNDAVTAMNPIYEDTYGIWGWDAVTIAASVDQITFSTPALAVTPANGVLQLSGSIPDLYVDAQAQGDVVGVDFDTDVLMWATSADIVGTVTLGAQDGMVTATITDVSVDLVGFGYDTSLLPGDIESYILVDTLRSTIEDQVVAAVQDQVPALIDSALAGLDLSFETKLMGTPLTVAADITRVDVDGDGVELGLDMAVDMPDTGVSGQGVLASDPADPSVDRSVDMAAAISDDLLNRMLYEAWSAGLLNLELSTYDGSLEPFLLTPLHAEEGTISVSADLPPVMVEKDGHVQVQIAELMVSIDTPGGELGSHLKLAVTAFVGIDLLYDSGEIALDMGDVNLSLMVRESDWGASNEAVTQLVEEMLPLDTMLALLGNISFPVPEIQGLTLTDVVVDRDQSGVHTDMTATLE